VFDEYNITKQQTNRRDFEWPRSLLAQTLSGVGERGLNNAEIAQRLYLSEGTVRNYVSAILTKLDVSDRTQAAVLALRAGLADLQDES
jgi:hypothetical protein